LLYSLKKTNREKYDNELKELQESD
jgi:hypothetical protein